MESEKLFDRPGYFIASYGVRPDDIVNIAALTNRELHEAETVAHTVAEQLLEFDSTPVTWGHGGAPSCSGLDSSTLAGAETAFAVPPDSFDGPSRKIGSADKAPRPSGSASSLFIGGCTVPLC